MIIFRLGISKTFSPEARPRYEKHFGPFNQMVELHNHTLVLIDAPGLAEEDYIRNADGVSYSQWSPLPGGPIEFVRSVASGKHSRNALAFDLGDYMTYSCQSTRLMI
jgi:ethanolamine phosphate phosphodiesterase